VGTAHTYVWLLTTEDAALFCRGIWDETQDGLWAKAEQCLKKTRPALEAEGHTATRFHITTEEGTSNILLRGTGNYWKGKMEPMDERRAPCGTL